MGYVYMIQNVINHKIYIGSTVNYKKRFLSHRNSLKGGYHNNRRLQKDYNAYGEEAFAYILLCEENDEEERFALEADIIQALRTYKWGYNLTIDGRGRYIASAKTREKMRKNTLGENNPFYGRTHSEETKRKLSEKAQKRTGSKNPFFGRTHSQETIEKIAKSYNELKKSGWINPQKGVPKTKEAKRNNALSQPSRKPVHAEGKDYISVSECAKDLGVVNATVRNRIKSDKFPDYYFIDDKTPNDYRKPR